MSNTEILNQASYSRLLADIRKIIAQGRARAAKAAGRKLIRAYWEVGRRVCDEKLTERGGYGASILEDLAEELEIDASTLLRCIHFFQSYKSVPAGGSLTWSHYKVLLPLNNPKERQWYEGLVNREGLTSAQLAEAIKKQRFEESQKDKGKQTAKKKLTRPNESTYVYKARVERVVDGDTLLIGIDLGFAVWKQQHVRLAGVDCPPIDKPNGREAFEYVRDTMAKVPFVMVKTNKIDIYGRYIAYVFYSFKNEDKAKVFERGRYLNQELLDKGFARRI